MGAAGWMTNTSPMHMLLPKTKHASPTLERSNDSEVLLGGCNPRPAHCAAHNFHDVVMAHHMKAIGPGARVGIL
jgi:hypothetical protein